MNAIILSAGKGSRLSDITTNIPKPMIKIGGKPILEHNLEWLKSFGIKDVFINLHHLPEVIKKYFDDGSKWGMNIKYSYESDLLGTAGGVRKIYDEFFMPNDLESFLVIYGDNMFKCDLSDIISFHKKKKPKATIAVYEIEDVSQSGVVLFDEDGKIKKFIEKPKKDEIASNFVNTGIYILDPDVLNYIPLMKPYDFGKDVFPGMLQKRENIFATIIRGELIPVDTPELLKKAALLEE